MSLLITKPFSQVFACLALTNQNTRMSTADIRRKQLKAWFADKSLPEKEKSYLSQLINGKTSFGERAARRIERDYGMRPGYLDIDEHNPDKAVNDGILLVDELELLMHYRAFPDSEKKAVLREFKAKHEKFNTLFQELLASRKK
jgi:hypothetical protein